MLKLEKKSWSRPVSVRMRDSGRMLSPLFFRALALALGFHLLGFAIFQVKPISIGHIDIIFPPVQVNIELASMQEGGVSAQLEGKGVPANLILEPKQPTPDIPMVSRLRMMRDIAYPKMATSSVNPFKSLENSVHLFGSLHLSPPIPESATPIVIRISGELAQRKVLSEGREVEKFLGRKLQDKKIIQFLATYDVKVENRTGKIFWYKEKETSKKKKHREYAEKVLNGIRFERDIQGFVTCGQVEILFTVSEGESLS